MKEERINFIKNLASTELGITTKQLTKITNSTEEELLDINNWKFYKQFPKKISTNENIYFTNSKNEIYTLVSDFGITDWSDSYIFYYKLYGPNMNRIA